MPLGSLCYRCRKLNSERTVHGLHESCFMEWFGLRAPEEFQNVISRTTTESSPKPGFVERLHSSFFHGKFRKYTADLGGQSYLLKVQQKDFPELPASEYLCNQIAQTIGLEIPPYYLILFEGSPAFLSRTFIQRGQRKNLVHIYHYIKKNERFDCSTLLRIIERETGRLSEVERFVELCLFDALIGNHDRHGRNLAMIESPNQKRLSPFYDNPSYLGVEEEHLLGAQHSPRGSIATQETTEPSMRDYVLEFRALKQFKIVEHFQQALDLKNILRLVDESFVSEKRKLAFRRLITQRAEELKNAPK